MSQDQQWNALKRIVRRLPAQSVYYASALGAIVLAGGGQLPPGLEFVAGGIGANVLSNLIEEIARSEDVLDDDIRTRAEDAIQRSDIANLLTKQDFLQGYARLLKRLDAQKTISQDILDELRTGFAIVATADQVEELKQLLLQLIEQPAQKSQVKTRVFISYARADDEIFVEKLYNDLKDKFDVWWDRETMSNRGKTFLQEIRDAIDWSDRLILVVGPGAFTSEYVRDEWQYAYETYKGINIALRLGDYTDFPEQLSGFDAPDFRDDDDYDERLVTLKRQILEPLAPVGAFHNVPALPPHFLQRLEYLDALRDLVIADVDKPTLISAEKLTTAVEGMGGIGKSVLATAFAHDRKVRFAFPDGIVWLTVGRNPSMYELYRAVGVALGDELSNYPDEITARQNAQKMLADKKCLLILDDVWELPVGRAFRDLISGTSTRLLITTRNLQITNMLNANKCGLNLIDESQAVVYLRRWVGDDPDLKTIVEKLGYLFLALKLAGSIMKKGDLSGAEYLRIYNRVSRMKVNRQATDREDSLEASIALSVNAVFEGIEGKTLLYYTLGIFPEDTTIPQNTIIQFWKYLFPRDDEFDLLEILNTLVDVALVEKNVDDKTLIQHDLLHQFAREQLRDQYATMHDKLLSSYNSKRRKWHEIADDGYIYQHLAMHLTLADDYDSLGNLFKDEHWMNVRVSSTTRYMEGYLNDIDYYLAGIRAKLHKDVQEIDLKYLVSYIRGLLIRQSIITLLKEYPDSMLANNLKDNRLTTTQVLQIIKRKPKFDEQFNTLKYLLSVGEIHAKKQDVIAKATVELVQNNKPKLGEIISILPEYMRHKVASDAINKPVNNSSYKHIIHFLDYLPEQKQYVVIEQSLATLDRITGTISILRDYINLFSYGNEHQKEQIVTKIENIMDKQEVTILDRMSFDFLLRGVNKTTIDDICTRLLDDTAVALQRLFESALIDTSGTRSSNVQQHINTSNSVLFSDQTHYFSTLLALLPYHTASNRELIKESLLQNGLLNSENSIRSQLNIFPYLTDTDRPRIRAQISTYLTNNIDPAILREILPHIPTEEVDKFSQMVSIDKIKFELLPYVSKLQKQRLLNSLFSQLPMCYQRTKSQYWYDQDRVEYDVDRHVESWSETYIVLVSGLAPYMNPDEVSDTIKKVKVMLRRLENLHNEIFTEFIVAFRQYLSDDLVIMLKGLKEPRDRVKSITEVISYVEGEQHQLLKDELLSSFQSLKYDRFKYQFAAFVIPNFPLIEQNKLRNEIQNYIIENLEQGSNKPRANLLNFLADTKIFNTTILSQACMAQIAASIFEVCINWKWR